jgi:hypothetical protein
VGNFTGTTGTGELTGDARMYCFSGNVAAICRYCGINR